MSADLVSFTLAHPLGSKHAAELGLEETVYPVGSELQLPRAYAMRLVGAGMVQGADPTDHKTVRAALKQVAAPGKPAPVGAEQPAESAPAGKPKPGKGE
ncbi:hypothetical protein [Nonomuraea sp. NPDC003214]